MNRLAAAHAAYVAALKEERAEIDRQLALLESAVPREDDDPEISSAPRSKRAASKPAERTSSGRGAKSSPPRRGRMAGLGTLQPSLDPPKKFKPCPECGRDDVAGRQGGSKVFHYAKPCGLPCSGSSAREMKNSAEDVAAGVHQLKVCKNPKCVRVKYA